MNTKHIVHPVNLHWKIHKKKAMEALTPYIESEEIHFVEPGIGALKYSLRLDFNSVNSFDINSGEVFIYLILKTPGKYAVQADCKILTKPFNHVFNIQKLFATSGKRGFIMGSYKEFLRSCFNPSDELDIYLTGSLSYDTGKPRPKLERMPIGKVISEFKEKDFTLVVEGKEIHVFKFLLAAYSPVFAAMIKHSMVEAKTDRVEITDFSYDVVSAAIAFLHQDVDAITESNFVEVCRFADKYDFMGFKDVAEEYMLKTLDVSNVCAYINASFYLGCETVREHGLQVVLNCIKNKVMIKDCDRLNPEFYALLLSTLLRKSVKTVSQ